MVLSFLFLMACKPPLPLSPDTTIVSSSKNIKKNGNTILSRFDVPNGYQRLTGDYAYFLRHIPLKPEGSPVHLYNGQLKSNQDVHAAILDYDTGQKDLQQCADAVIRIRSEFLFSQNKLSHIQFHFTNGFVASYLPWMQGKRLQYQRGCFLWTQNSHADSSHSSLRSFLDYVYNFAGSLSLSRELVSVPSIEDIQPGDVWIVGGSPGHAVTVMDVAQNNKGEKVFLLSQGYMPAQEIHILKNDHNPDLSPWYAIHDIEAYLYTPEYTFPRNSLKRFPLKN